VTVHADTGTTMSKPARPMIAALRDLISFAFRQPLTAG
jgi:hypothetical protein